MSEVYLDHHSGTSPLPVSVDALVSCLRGKWGSTTSVHQRGQELILEGHKQTALLLDALGASPSDRFYFFASHADAIEHLFFSFYLEQIRHSGRNHILTTPIEEATILLSLKRMEELGCCAKMLNIDPGGRLNVSCLNQAIHSRSALLSLAWASGLTGIIHPIGEIAKMCKKHQIALHVDASYVLGKIPFCFREIEMDFLTFDGSVLHAPKGTAGLLVKEKTSLTPPLSATTSVHVGGIAALAQAMIVVQQQVDFMQLEILRLRYLFEQKVKEGYPEAVVLFEDQEKLPNCTTIAFPGVMSDALLFLLNRQKVYASLGGGHCQKLSHLLIASHIDAMRAQSALSFSLSFNTTESEVEQAADVVVTSALRLRKLSSHLMRPSL